MSREYRDLLMKGAPLDDGGDAELEEKARRGGGLFTGGSGRMMRAMRERRDSAYDRRTSGIFGHTKRRDQRELRRAHNAVGYLIARRNRRRPV